MYESDLAELCSFDLLPGYSLSSVSYSSLVS